MGIEHNQWAAYFKEFNLRNRWRLTRLVMLNERGEEEQERSLPLVGLSLEADHEGSLRIHIMLGERDVTDPRRQTYTITGVKRVIPKCGVGGRDEVLEIEDEQGEKNLLWFDPSPVVYEMKL
jgi:Family of unknown function (DUF5335)